MDNLVCLDDFEVAAKRGVSDKTWAFWANGSDDSISYNRNMDIFKRCYIRSRVLTDVSSRDVSLSVLGHQVAFPVGVSPTGMQALAHPEAEIATAKACEKIGTIYIQSTNSSKSIQEIASAVPGVRRWFQLNVFKDRDLTKRLVNSAEQNGFEAIVLTVDTPPVGIRRAELRTNFQTETTANYTISAEVAAKAGHKSVVSYMAKELYDSSLQWKDLVWLRGITRLPIILKGILTAEDAELACQHQMDGVIVSNHGGRQLDTAPTTLEALPEVLEAVAGRCDVFLDGGVRTGTDVFKALALGAKLVFVGRPALYGLTVAGTDGVFKVLSLLKEEFSIAMGHTGCCGVSDIRRNMVVPDTTYQQARHFWSKL